MSQKNFSSAIEAFKKSADQTPHFKTYELLGECYFELQQFSQAVPYLAAATTLNRGVRAPSILAETLYQLGDHHLAQEMAELALTRDSQNQKAKNILERIQLQTKNG